MQIKRFYDGAKVDESLSNLTRFQNDVIVLEDYLRNKTPEELLPFMRMLYTEGFIVRQPTSMLILNGVYAINFVDAFGNRSRLELVK